MEKTTIRLGKMSEAGKGQRRINKPILKRGRTGVNRGAVKSPLSNSGASDGRRGFEPIPTRKDLCRPGAPRQAGK